MKNFFGKISVLIIDDHALTRFALKTALEANQNINLIAQAETSERGLDMTRSLRPDTVVINLDLPSSGNIKTVEKIKAIDENIKIIVLAASNSEEEILEALYAGAQAYCLKGITPKKLVYVIDFVSDGALWFDPLIAENIRNILLRKKNILKPNFSASDIDKEVNEKPQLTERELDVLKLIVDGYSNAEISEKLCVSIHTSKAHVCNILHKLSVDDRTQAAIKALKAGII